MINPVKDRQWIVVTLHSNTVIDGSNHSGTRKECIDALCKNIGITFNQFKMNYRCRKVIIFSSMSDVKLIDKYRN